jgi:hypothetical protein
VARYTSGGVECFSQKEKWMCLCKINTRNSLKLFNNMKVIGEKLQPRSIKIKDLKSFVDYLDSENYQTSTIERQIGRFRFFLEPSIRISK